MNLEALIDRFGENGTLALAGLAIGLAFGFLAQRSRFCLRSAVIEFARNQAGGKLTVWLFAFANAVLATQLLELAGTFDARVLAAQGKLRSMIGSMNMKIFRASAGSPDPAGVTQVLP